MNLCVYFLHNKYHDMYIWVYIKAFICQYPAAQISGTDHFFLEDNLYIYMFQKIIVMYHKNCLPHGTAL